MNQRLIGLMASAALLTLLPGALQASPFETGHNSRSAAHKRAGRLLAGASEALARGVPSSAVRQAEAAVAIRPRDAQARALLGRAYLAAGRFRSAEAALGDALTLDSSLSRAAVARALAEIALGKPEAALLSLEAARGGAADADIGLALALMGRTEEARETLLAAAREPGADARTRQNLALSYALEGRWNDAATIAAQDVPPELVADRLHRWAMVGQMRNDPAMQVGALLGVLPAVDTGLPAELALLLPGREKETAAPILFAEAAPLQLAPALPPVVPLVRIDEGAVVTETNPAPPPLIEIAALPVPEAAEPSAPAPSAAAVEKNVRITAWAGAPRMRSRRNPPIAAIEPVKPVTRPTVSVRALRAEPRMTAPKPVLMVSRATLKPLSAVAKGWSVQLGAFRSAARTEIAWERLNRRANFLHGHVPTGSTVRRGHALFHRLSIGGIAGRADAVALCRKVRKAGGACFVRRDSGDRPMTWALRTKAAEPA